MNTTPQPLDNEVHMYCLALPQRPSELSRLGRLLTGSENDRANLLKSDLAKKRFIAGRGVLREILGGYLGVEPEQVQIATGEHGKPFLAECKENLCFNLSHSEDVLLLAVTTGLEVGVDIEAVEPGKPINNIARISFSRSEQDELFSIPSPHQQTEAFYRCWVRKEACLKACGRGFSLPGNSFDVSPISKQTAILNVSCDQTNWHVLDIDVPQRFCAALAVEARSSTTRPICSGLPTTCHALECFFDVWQS